MQLSGTVAGCIKLRTECEGKVQLQLLMRESRNLSDLLGGKFLDATAEITAALKPMQTPRALGFHCRNPCNGSRSLLSMNMASVFPSNKAAAAAAGGGDGLQRSRDWLYESYYCMSQQHPLIVFLLLIVMGACLALLAVFFALGLEVEDHVAFLITVPTALAIFFAIFILVCIESVFKKLLRVFSLVIWICLVAMGYLFMCFGGSVSPWDQVGC
ncbi:adenylate cyclase type 2-like [Octodon degus]|uniref:Adenylate cyclase type 2-like n=1 Tax=Octodon degus TaxID=10160 RepID=A0A6P6DK92_OCTDE|nr:adenylate cyclase type 2-like [Octodon degus]